MFSYLPVILSTKGGGGGVCLPKMLWARMTSPPTSEGRPSRYDQQAGGTHPSGMHTCLKWISELLKATWTGYERKLELWITNLIWYSRPEFLPVLSGTSLSYPEFQVSDFSSWGMCSLLPHSVFSIDPPFPPSWPQAQVEAVPAAAVEYCFRSYFVCIGDKFWMYSLAKPVTHSTKF